MDIINIIENKSIIVDKSYILNDDKFGTLNKQSGMFSIAYKPKGMEITAGNKIGLIPVNEKLSLNVQPKVDINNFFYLLSMSKRKINILSDFYRKYNQSADNFNLIDIFTNVFLASMKILEREGIYRGYKRKVENSSTPKGKILYKKNLYENIFKGIDYKAVHCYSELDRDIIENQIIKYTIEYLINYYRLIKKSGEKFLIRLNYYREIFSRVTYISWVSEINQVEFNKIIVGIPKLRSYYVETLEICNLIVNKSSFQFEQRSSLSIQKSLPSIYIDMEDVFEQYLINSLRDLSDSYCINIYKGRKLLFMDVEKPEIEPDIVFENNRNITCIADAKYKKIKVSREDIFQMISYLVSYNCFDGVFILPLDTNAKRVDYLGSIQERKIYIFRIDINKKDINEMRNEEQLLYNFLLMTPFEKQVFYLKNK